MSVQFALLPLPLRLRLHFRNHPQVYYLLFRKVGGTEEWRRLLWAVMDEGFIFHGEVQKCTAHNRQTYRQ